MTGLSRRAALGVALFAVFALAGCDERKATYQGWVEAEMLFVGPDEGGRVTALTVKEGDKIAAGQSLFTVDDDLQQADVVSATATLTNARQVFERAQQLVKTGAGTQKDFDSAQAALRDAEARLNAAKTRLARRQVASPAAGSIEQVYYRGGEMVAAGKPVVALLPPGNVKLRFFVPQAVLPKISLGDAVKVSCDGCAGDLTARISFIARSAEFTPPVIYSRDERDKLVFLVEARPERPELLRVGQPVDVTLTAKDASP